MSRPALSVVIPAYNESKRLTRSLELIVDYLSRRQEAFEIVVVDDGSSDDTAELAAHFAESRQSPAKPGQWTLRVLVNSRNRGKGYSVRRGMLEARGHYALLTDADLSTPIEELAKLEREVRQSACQIALGSRGLKTSEVEVPQHGLRRLSGRTFNVIMRLVTGLPFKDTQCGFKLFELGRCRQLFQAQLLDGFGFDVEVLYLARKCGLRMAEVAVVWRNVEGSTVSFSSGLKAVWDLAVIRYYDIKRRYQTRS
ncbi:MAG TPA: dolichyl-phosphate beta-glucosyltransferase [Acidobacteriota bacterium]|nr:dolichyl-phosphate beta-glucosyltransferase [Acidobacteriota bacterium]